MKATYSIPQQRKKAINKGNKHPYRVAERPSYNHTTSPHLQGGKTATIKAHKRRYTHPWAGVLQPHMYCVHRRVARVCGRIMRVCEESIKTAVKQPLNDHKTTLKRQVKRWCCGGVKRGSKRCFAKQWGHNWGHKWGHIFRVLIVLKHPLYVPFLWL